MNEKELLKNIMDDYAKESNWPSFKVMAQEVNIVIRDVRVVAERFAKSYLNLYLETMTPVIKGQIHSFTEKIEKDTEDDDRNFKEWIDVGAELALTILTKGS